MRPRRHIRPAFFSTVGGRRLLRQLGIIAGAVLVGYVVTLWLYPAPIIARGNAVPRVIEMARGEALGRLTKQGFRTKVDGEESHPKAPKGFVIWQDPPPGTVLSRGALVHVVLSSGAAPIPVPDVTGLEGTQAAKILTAAGFAVERIDSTASTTERGVALSTQPEAGGTRAPGSPIVLLVSSGPGEAAVPDLIGSPVREARRRLIALGFQVGTVATEASIEAEGTVLDQAPIAGSVIARESRVNLVVSRKPTQ